MSGNKWQTNWFKKIIPPGIYPSKKSNNNCFVNGIDLPMGGYTLVALIIWSYNLVRLFLFFFCFVVFCRTKIFPVYLQCVFAKYIFIIG